MIEILNKDDSNTHEFFYKPPVNMLTLCFTDRDLEDDYRHPYGSEDHDRSKPDSAIASTRLHSFIEIILSLILYLLICVVGFLVFDRSVAYVVVFIICLLLKLLVVLDMAVPAFSAAPAADDDDSGGLKHNCKRFAEFTSSWYMRNFVGVVMAALPVVAIYFNLSCLLVESDAWLDRFLCFCIITSLLSFANFSWLVYWLKSTVATVVGCVLLVLLNFSFCDFWDSSDSTTLSPPLNSTTLLPNTTASYTTTTVHTPISDHLFSGKNQLRLEIILDILLLLILIWFLNREFEISYRLSFHGSYLAERDTRQMQVRDIVL
jgi:adenylate cyclase 9